MDQAISSIYLDLGNLTQPPYLYLRVVAHFEEGYNQVGWFAFEREDTPLSHPLHHMPVESLDLTGPYTTNLMTRWVGCVSDW